MGTSRKQIAFDLSHEALKQRYPRRETAQDPQFFKRAYKDIQRFMSANGFERRQHSVYVSTGEMTTLDVVCLMRRMASQLPWISQCAEKVDATDIGAQHSLLGLLRSDTQIDVSIDRQADERPPALLSQDKADGWGFYIIADLKTWADNAENRSQVEHYSSFEEAKARFNELRSEGYNSEITDPGSDGQPLACLTLGLESADGMSAADILHVRQGKNYLVTDFVRMERLRDDPAGMDILSRVSCEIGFDRVRVWEQADGGRQLLSIVPFVEWDNPYFSAATPGSIAAKYCDFLHECYPLPKEDGIRDGQIAQVVQYLQKEGKVGASQLKLAVAGLAASFAGNAAVQGLAKSLTEELSQYQKSASAKQPKRQKKISRER